MTLKTPVLVPSKKKGKATELSEKIADRLSKLRADLGLTQRGMAEKIGVTFQQYQKYEKAKDRLSLERSVVLCEKLGISLDFFNVADGKSKPMGFAETEQAPFGAASKTAKKALTAEEEKLLAAFNAIPKNSRKNFLETALHLAKTLSGKN